MDFRRNLLDRAAVRYTLLRRNVSQVLDTTGWGTVLVMLDVILSLTSVVAYIVTTYNVSVVPLYTLDLVLACIFSLNWLLWLWVAEDWVGYVFSFWSFIDFITIIPSFVLYAVERQLISGLTGLNFVRVLRILRVLRIFRMKHVMSRHLEGAVTEAAGKLAFSLISILFIAAGMFFELEKYGPDSELAASLTFHESLYWAAVTLSTVGYGDLSPSYWATQTMLIVLLMLMFTLLPYLTGQLMDAISASSPYQRNRFKRFNKRGGLQHTVFMGAIDATTMKGLLDQLYHEDKGFNRQCTVFLSPQAPEFDVQHILATHAAGKKILYLQGSPFRMEDLNRAGVQYAAAVFIIAPKHAVDPGLADRHIVMMALTLGQYLQEAHVAITQELSFLPNRISHWLTHGTAVPPKTLPAVFVQIVLPEGRLRLYQVLQSLQETPGQGLTGHSTAVAAAAAAAAAAADVTQAAVAAAAAALVAAKASSGAGDGGGAAADVIGGKSSCRADNRGGDDDDAFVTAAASPTAGGSISRSSGGGCQVTPAAQAAYQAFHSVRRASVTRGASAKAAAAAETGTGTETKAAAAGGGGGGDEWNRAPAAASRKSLFSFTPAAVAEATSDAKQQNNTSGYGGRSGSGSGSGSGVAAGGGGTGGGSSGTEQGAAADFVVGCQFWKVFGESMHVLCLGELKNAFMAHSLVAAPGVITMLTNLAITTDFGNDILSRLDLPEWMKDYQIGAGQEIYEVREFPAAFWGLSFRQAAGFIFDLTHAVLLAVEGHKGHEKHCLTVGSLDLVIQQHMHGYIISADVSAALVISTLTAADYETWLTLRHQKQHKPTHSAGNSTSAAAAAAGAAAGAGAVQAGTSMLENNSFGGMMAAAPPHAHVVVAGGGDGGAAAPADVRQPSDVGAAVPSAAGHSAASAVGGHVVAANTVIDADVDAFAEPFELERIPSQGLGGSASSSASSAFMRSRQSVRRLQKLQHKHQHQQHQQHQQQQQQQQFSASTTHPGAVAAAATSASGGNGTQQQDPCGRSWRQSSLKTSSSVNLPVAETNFPRGLADMVAESNRQQQEELLEGQLHTLHTHSWVADDREEWLFDPTGITVEELQQQQREQQQQQSAATAAAATAAVAAIAAAGTAGTGHKDRAVHTGAFAALIHLLRSPSKLMRSYGEAFMRQHYHMRPKGCVTSAQDMVVHDVQLGGHILVVGTPRSQEGLLALLAPLRSRRLSRWRPIVILDQDLPGSGGCWKMLAQFKDTYFVQVVDGLNDALLRSSADSAAQAILVSPLSVKEGEAEDSKLASQVMTDATVLNMYQLLKSLNPDMLLVTELILLQNISYLAATSPLRGVDMSQQPLLAPAYISGSVFMAKVLDDLLISSYSNNASDRIVLQLLHRWHMTGGGLKLVQHMLHHNDHQEQEQEQQQQQEQQPEPPGSPINGPSASPGNATPPGPAATDVEQGGLPPTESYRESGNAKALPHSSSTVMSVLSSSIRRVSQLSRTQSSSPGCQVQQQQQQHEVQQQQQQVAYNITTPTILQIAVDAPAGSSYGRYFHQLLLQRNLLLLGLYRQVSQDGLSFRATITNPHYKMQLQEGDIAFVVACLDFPDTFHPTAEQLAAAWPPGILGFSALSPPPEPHPDYLVPEALDLEMYDLESAATTGTLFGDDGNLWFEPGGVSGLGAAGRSGTGLYGAKSGRVPQQQQQQQLQSFGDASSRLLKLSPRNLQPGGFRPAGLTAGAGAGGCSGSSSSMALQQQQQQQWMTGLAGNDSAFAGAAAHVPGGPTHSRGATLSSIQDCRDDYSLPRSPPLVSDMSAPAGAASSGNVGPGVAADTAAGAAAAGALMEGKGGLRRGSTVKMPGGLTFVQQGSRDS